MTTMMMAVTTTPGTGMPPKPCLKRRCSEPPRTNNSAEDLTHGASFCSSTVSRSRGGSCDSLNDSSCSGDSLVSASKKSVSFADSIGADLCRVKVFRKDLCEFEGEMTDRTKRWQLQHQPLWYFGNDDEDEDEEDEDDLIFFGTRQNKVAFDDPDHADLIDELYDDFDEDFFKNSLSLQQPSGEEEFDDEDAFKEFDEYFAYSLSQDEEVIQMEKAIADFREASRLEQKNFSNDIRSSRKSNEENSSSGLTVESTFLEPKDLPDFQETLKNRGVRLESANILNNQRIISGTIRIFQSEDQRPVQKVSVKYSTDGWKSSSVAPTTSVIADDQYAYVLETRNLIKSVGDALELVVVVETTDQTVMKDDNGGVGYRFICKKPSKFRPGKSLW